MSLSAIGWIYGKAANLRNTLYEKGVFKSHTLGAKTFSIGNITVGGTGKTPLVAYVAEILAAKGEKVCILTRGYGRENPKNRVLVSDGLTVFADARTAGDEPFELANKLIGKAIVISDANRVRAAKWARESFSVTAFVLDDAFQHRKARRDLNIVLLDATDPFGGEKVLPGGNLREPLENLKRADAVVITRANLENELRITNYELRIRQYNRDCPIFVSRNEIDEISELKSQDSRFKIQDSRFKIQDSRFKAQNSLAFCALGNPENFFEQMKRENFNLTAVEKFPDHHFYTQKDVEKLQTAAKNSGSEAFLTTAKDAAKLVNLKFQLPCFVVSNRLVFDKGRKFIELIESVK